MELITDRCKFKENKYKTGIDGGSERAVPLQPVIADRGYCPNRLVERMPKLRDQSTLSSCQKSAKPRNRLLCPSYFGGRENRGVEQVRGR